MLALIDGDVLAYQACRPRWEKKATVVEGVSFIQLDDHGKRKPLEFTREEDRWYLEESWENFKRDLRVLLDTVFCDEFLMAVKGADNFRNVLWSDYKLNRHPDPNKQNMFVPAIRKLAVIEGYAVAADGREADDLLRIWAEEARGAGDDYVVCTIDKDLKCIPGKYFNMGKGNRVIEEISEWDALKHYYAQLIAGDPTDYIPGIPGMAMVKANKAIAECQTEEDLQEVVVGLYIANFGDDWKQMLLSNGKMIHLQKTMDDYFVLSDWKIVKELDSI